MGYIQFESTRIDIVSSSESESRTSSVTQYPVESGSPVSDNAMYSGGSITISGFLLGSNSEDSFNTLIEMQRNARLVTYRGRIYWKDAVIQDIGKGYERYENGFSVTITLQEIRIASAVWDKIPQPPIAKQPSKPSTAVYVTVKKGDTYWGWWQQYGTAIQTLRDWNKWPDRVIPIGARARVK